MGVDTVLLSSQRRRSVQSLDGGGGSRGNEKDGLSTAAKKINRHRRHRSAVVDLNADGTDRVSPFSSLPLSEPFSFGSAAVVDKNLPPLRKRSESMGGNDSLIQVRPRAHGHCSGLSGYVDMRMSPLSPSPSSPVMKECTTFETEECSTSSSRDEEEGSPPPSPPSDDDNKKALPQTQRQPPPLPTTTLLPQTSSMSEDETWRRSTPSLPPLAPVNSPSHVNYEDYPHHSPDSNSRHRKGRHTRNTGLVIHDGGIDSSALGAHHEAAGRYVEALEAYGKRERDRGRLLWKMGHYRDASAELQRACVAGNKRRKDADTWHDLARVHLSMGDRTEATRCFTRSLQLAGSDDRRSSQAVAGLATVLVEDGDTEGAAKLLATVSNHFEESEDPTALIAEGAVLEERGLHRHALERYRLAEAVATQPVDEAVAILYAGRVLGRTRHRKEAMELCERALYIFQEWLGPHHRNVGSALHALGMLYAESDNLTEARRCLREALRIQRAALGDRHADVAVTLESLSWVDLAVTSSSGEMPSERAVKLYHKALHVRRRAFGEDHFYVGLTYQRLGSLYAYADQDDAAVAQFQKAQRVFQTLRDEDRVRETKRRIRALEERQRCRARSRYDADR